MMSSPTHPGGAILGGGGYISAGVIVRDLGITPWWRPVDARAALAAIADPSASAPSAASGAPVAGA
jgi:hypothetical protein